MQAYLPGTGAALEAVKRRASPATYVSADDPPFLIMHGERDSFLPPVHSQQLHQQLTSAGVRSELILVKNAGHTFAPVGGEISPGFEEMARLMANFFDREIKGA